VLDQLKLCPHVNTCTVSLQYERSNSGSNEYGGREVQNKSQLGYKNTKTSQKTQRQFRKQNNNSENTTTNLKTN